MKVDIDLVKTVLRRSEPDVRKVAVILEDIEAEIRALQEETATAPRIKKQFVILVADPEGKLPPENFGGWILQIPEDDSPLTVLDRLHKSAYDFNMTPKGRRCPIEFIGEACEFLPARMAKENELWIKTREPVLVVRTDNRIPMEAAGQ